MAAKGRTNAKEPEVLVPLIRSTQKATGTVKRK
jgi:hypothetical protein